MHRALALALALGCSGDAADDTGPTDTDADTDTDTDVDTDADTDTDTGSTDTGSADTGSADTGTGDTGTGDTGTGDTGPSDTGPSDTGPSDTGPTETGDTGPVAPENVWVLGSDDGTDRACIFALDPATLDHRSLYCVPFGSDGAPAEVFRVSRVRDVGGTRAVALSIRLQGLNAAGDEITFYELVVVDLDAEVGTTVWSWPLSGPGASSLLELVVEAPDRAVVITYDVDASTRYLWRVDPAGPVAVPHPPGFPSLQASADDGVLVAVDGRLGRVDTAGAWTPMSDRNAEAFFGIPLVDGRVAWYENVDEAGKEFGQIAIASLGAAPVVDGRTLEDWGEYRNISRVLAAGDGTVLVVSDGQVSSWDGTESAVPTTRFQLDWGSSGAGVAASPAGGFVAPASGTLSWVDAAGAVTLTSCTEGTDRYVDAAFSPTGTYVLASIGDGQRFGRLQRCDASGQPADVTATTGLRGAALAWPALR